MTVYRIEKDSLGDVKVPKEAYYGAQTQRAFVNFPISGLRMPREFIRAIGIVKWAAAESNLILGLLEEEIGEAIITAAHEVIDGKFDHDFIVDIYQTGSGTSTNMNANEIIANRAIEILGGKIGSKCPVHPNDHVNKGQSSNDVIPTAIHIAALESIKNKLLVDLKYLHESLMAKAEAFHDIIKIGRTHLQDAVPIRLGQEFSGYASQIGHGIQRLKNVIFFLSELALGGTAVGTGMNTSKQFAELAIKKISEFTKIEFIGAGNHFEAQSAQDALVETSGQLKTIAVSLMKIANDLRWLSSGPHCGIGEITLPALQPGSSIMPGKINPVIAESVMMICATVIGNDSAITIGGQHGNFELNAMMPMMAYHLLQSIRLLTNGTRNLVDRCVNGIEANKERMESFIENSLAMAMSLVPKIGYDKATKITHDAFEKKKTIRQIVLEQKLFSEQELNELLDPIKLAASGKLD
jgi:fumarate hydratase, class II